MAPRARGGRYIGGRANSTPLPLANSDLTPSATTTGGRIQKPTIRGRGRGRGRLYKNATLRPLEEQIEVEARDDAEPTSEEPTPTSKVTRSPNILHACSELSLQFVSLAGLPTSDDTNTIALNLMDYFLFSDKHWLPALSYCKLHAACFLMASRVTGQDISVEQIADSLAPETVFIQMMAAPLACDEDEAAAIQQVISVDVDAVEDGYRLLYDRKDALKEVVGGYDEEIEDILPLPKGKEEEIMEEQEDASPALYEEDFDIFDGT